MKAFFIRAGYEVETHAAPPDGRQTFSTPVDAWTALLTSSADATSKQLVPVSCACAKAVARKPIDIAKQTLAHFIPFLIAIAIQYTQADGTWAICLPAQGSTFDSESPFRYETCAQCTCKRCPQGTAA